MIYGFASTTTSKETKKQKQNIRFKNDDIDLRSGNEAEWKKLMRDITEGDTLIVDGIKILGDKPESAFEMYKELIGKGISLKFCLQPYLDSDVFMAHASSEVEKEYALNVIREQIGIAFSKNIAISSGLDASKGKKNKQIGRIKGEKYETKKAEKAKKIIEEKSKCFDGSLSDKDLIEEIGLSRNTFYKYKREIEYSRTTIDSFRKPYGFLSNFADCIVTYEGLEYGSTEAAYQAAKLSTNEERKPFTHMTAKDAKTKGGKITLPDDWYDRNLDIMRDLLRLKFSQQPKFKDKLLSTGDKELCEGNDWHDNFWGACKCPECKDIEKHNWLGKMLMEVRDELRNEEKK